MDAGEPHTRFAGHTGVWGLARRRPPATPALALTLLLCAVLQLPPAAAGALPDGRAYELVSRPAPGGRETGLNGETPDFAAAATDGESVDWEGVGGCCGAGSAAVNLYRSQRTSRGWLTSALTPTPPEPLSGFSEGQEPVFWSADLRQTIFATPASYAAGAHRPHGSHAEDLYLQEAGGALTWLSQGPAGTGAGPYSAEFDAATPAANAVVFSSAEPLTEKAEGLDELNYPPQYLYLRNVSAETTTLLDVEEGHLLSPYGAILGDGSWLKEELIPPNYQGTTTHAISADATKVFFESPPPHTETEGAGPPHLYMRDLPEAKTVPIDNPFSTSGEVRYEGAAADGSLVFFTSDEGLAGASTANELYEFDTTPQQIGAALPMSVAPIGGGQGVLGVTAIANDGSSVYFVATDVLPAASPPGEEAKAGQPNLYRYETASGLTAFIATLTWPDVNQCDPDCGHGHPAGLIAEPDTARPAYPTPHATPDGSVLAFTSYGDLAEPASAPHTELVTPAFSGQHTIEAADVEGFAAGQRIAIGSGETEELDTIQSVEAPAHPGREPGRITLSEYGPDGFDGLVDAHPAGQFVAHLYSEVYRYSTAASSLACLSCAPGGAAGDSTLGPAGGGSYAPPGKPMPLNEDGSRVFFESPNPLLPEAASPPAGVSDPPENVYEWEHGQLHLISTGSGAGFHLDGTTPSGADVFITTHVQLTSPAAATGHEPTGEAEIYDARVAGGGFPIPPAEAKGCTEEACGPPSAGGGSPAFSTPQSAILGAAGLEEQAPAVATLTIAKITAGQRRAFARTSRLPLTVHASAPTTIAALLTTRTAGKTLAVAHASARLAKAGTVVLLLYLDPHARRLLARTGVLPLSIAVSSSPRAAVTNTLSAIKTLSLTLTRATVIGTAAKVAKGRPHA